MKDELAALRFDEHAVEQQRVKVDVQPQPAAEALNDCGQHLVDEVRRAFDHAAAATAGTEAATFAGERHRSLVCAIAAAQQPWIGRRAACTRAQASFCGGASAERAYPPSVDAIAVTVGATGAYLCCAVIDRVESEGMGRTGKRSACPWHTPRDAPITPTS